MPLRRMRLEAPPERRPADLKDPLQTLAKLWLEGVKAQPQRRYGRRAGETALQVIKTLGKDPEPNLTALKDNWAEIAGGPFASRTAPEKLTKGKDGGLTLVLRVEGAAAPLVQHQAPQILARVNLYAGPPGVSALSIVQGPIARKAPRPIARPARPSPASEAEIEAMLGDIKDEALKASLRRLGRGIYARATAQRS